MVLLLAATLGDLAWMAGQWRSTIDGTAMEESWLAPSGNLMLGMHRDVRANGKATFEFLRIQQTKDGVAYLAQPGGQPPTAFALKSVEKRRAVFENPKHDFPQRIIYWREGDKLCARVEGPMDGKEVSEQWCWARVP